MTEPTLRQIALDGLWHHNPGLVQLLGLCPLLAVTNSTINGLGLGLATLFTLIVSNGLIASVRRVIAPEIRIPIFVLIIASAVSIVELILQAYAPGLYIALGIFISLIVTNCAVIARAERFASRHSVPRALFDGAMMGCGFLLVLVSLGTLRELIGQGSLLRDAHLLFGEAAQEISLQLLPDGQGFLLAVLPPGAFIGLGLLLALKNAIDQKRAQPAPRAEAAMAIEALTDART